MSALSPKHQGGVASSAGSSKQGMTVSKNVASKIRGSRYVSKGSHSKVIENTGSGKEGSASGSASGSALHNQDDRRNGHPVGLGARTAAPSEKQLRSNKSANSMRPPPHGQAGTADEMHGEEFANPFEITGPRNSNSNTSLGSGLGRPPRTNAVVYNYQPARGK